MMAKDLCDLGAKWEIEGFVRIEMGFEIILCEFSDRLVFESAYERPSGKNQSFERMPQLDILKSTLTNTLQVEYQTSSTSTYETSTIVRSSPHF
jgi:hypothetical protein